MNRSTLLFLLWCFLMGYAVNGQSQNFEPVAEGWTCDENFQPHVATSPLTIGSEIRICIQPTNWTKTRGVVMRSIDRFVFSKGDRGRNGVQDVIKDGQLVDPGTVLDCQPGAEICTFKTKLSDMFFFPPKDDSGNPLPPSFTVIQGNGAVTMQYSTHRRERRLLRGTIDRQRALHGRKTEGTLAGTDDVQVQGIVISEIKGKGGEAGEGGDTGSSGTTGLASKWQSLPTWAKAAICVGIVSILVCCCCALPFFGWYAGVEAAKRKVRAQYEESGGTLDDDGFSLPSPGQDYCQDRNNRRSYSPSANQSYLDSSNRSTLGRRPPVRSSGRIPNRPYRSHSPQLYRGTDDDDDESTVETNTPSRNPRTSYAPGGSSSVSRTANKRHASLGPPPVQTRRSTGLSQSQHSYLPRRGSSGVSVNSNRNQNNLFPSDRSTYSNRPSINNGNNGARTANGLSQSQHTEPLPGRVSSGVSVNSSQNKNNTDLSDRSTHSNRPLTRTTYHGTPSGPGRMGPRRSFGPDTTRPSMAGRGRSEHGRGSHNNHGPPPIRIPVRSDQSRRPPGQLPPHVVHVAEDLDSSSSTDGDDMASFASSTSSSPSTQKGQSDAESLSESTSTQNKQATMNTVNTKKVAPPPRTGTKPPVKKWAKTDASPTVPTNTKPPVKKWAKTDASPTVRTDTKPPVKKWAKTPTVPGRAVSPTVQAETRRESVGNPPNDMDQSISKRVVTKKKKKKVVDDSPTNTEVVEEPPPTVTEVMEDPPSTLFQEENQEEEAWGDQLD